MEFDVDMELLRRIGLARETVESLNDGTASVQELRETLAVVRTQMSEDFTFLRHLFQSLEEGTESTDHEALGEATLQALEAAENYLFSESGEEAEALLEEAARPVLERLEGRGPQNATREEADSADGAPANAEEEEDAPAPEARPAGSPAVDLDHAALLLARVADEPAAMDDLRAALAELAATYPDLSGPLARLDGAGEDPEAAAEALTEAGLVVEELMLASEMLPEPAAPEGPGAPPGDPAGLDLPEDEPSASGIAPTDDGAASGPDPDAGSAGAATSTDDTPPPDADLLKDFLEEGTEHLDSAEVALLALEENPGDQESVNVVFRAFHTIKGVAGFMNLHDIADAAHLAESLLSRVRDGEIRFTPGIADLTLRAADLLRGLLDGVRPLLEGGAAVVPSGAREILEALEDEALIQRLVTEESARTGLAPVAGSAAEDGEAGSGTASAPKAATEETVRIRTDRLDRLVDLVGELVVAHSMVSQDPAVREVQTELARKVDHSTKILRELQDLSTSLRMVPLQGSFNRLARVVRDLGRKSGKPVRLTTSGETTELDRGMVNVITDPLVHMVRNAVDHAVEPPEERAAAGKPREAELHLAAYQANGGVVIEVRDDGRGLDREKILARAVERGVVEPDATLTDKQVYDLIFAAGFSTAEKVTEVSGRGVGMDVVRRSVESLRGVVDVDSVPGEGTTFYIRLPLTLAITEGMLLSVGGERYIVPMTKIRESFRPTADDLSTVAGRGECVSHHGDLLPLHRLGRLYCIEGAVDQPTEGLVVVVGDGRRRGALLVDEILDQQSFVVKPVAGLPGRVPGIAGGAVLGDGSVGLIVDPDEIMEEIRTRGSLAVA